MIKRRLTLFVACFAVLSLISVHMTEAERVKVMNRFLDKKVGSLIEIDLTKSFNRDIKDPTKLRTYIKITPPKNTEFTITKDPDVSDVKIRKETSIPLLLGRLDQAGKLSLRIKTGSKDEGHVYSWQTPHRLASVIPYNRDKDSLSETLVVMSCTVHKTEKERKIILNLLENQRWIIDFPEQHEPLEGSIFAANDAVRTNGTPKEKPSSQDPVDKYWTITRQGTYVMSANRFYINGMAGGTVGQCRYKLSGAPNDKQSGLIECHKTGIYDVLLTHLECSKSLTL